MAKHRLRDGTAGYSVQAHVPALGKVEMAQMPATISASFL